MAFKKGEVANPGGRPPGNTERNKFRQQIVTVLPEIIAEIVKQAMNGDLVAARMILDRCIPSLKPTSDAATLPDVPLGTLAERGMHIITAAAAGQITPDDAAGSMALLTAQAKLVEQTEIVQRLESIENALRK